MKFPIFDNILRISSDNQQFMIYSNPEQNILLFEGSKNDFVKEQKDIYKNMHLLSVLKQVPIDDFVEGMNNQVVEVIKLKINLDYSVVFDSKKKIKKNEVE